MNIVMKYRSESKNPMPSRQHNLAPCTTFEPLHRFGQAAQNRKGLVHAHSMRTSAQNLCAQTPPFDSNKGVCYGL